MEGHLFFVLNVLLASFIFKSCTPLDTIDTNRSLRDGETLVSAAGDFEFGFFSPTAKNTSRYVGIWYSKLSTKPVIWVANRNAPLSNALGYLNMINQGLLVLFNSTKSVVWSSNTSAGVQDPIVQLLNTGNLVVRNRNDDSSEIFWQSFDYPCDSIIPGMKLGIDLVTGLQRYQSSWKSTEDPAEGEYTASVDYNPNGYPQIVLKKGTTIRFRGGSWNGIATTGEIVRNYNNLQQIEFIFNETEISFVVKIQNTSTVARVVLNPSGTLQRQIWNEKVQDWEIFAAIQTDQCEVYDLCGAYAICNVQKSPICGCLDGFTKNSSNQSAECVRRVPLNCSDVDRFIKYEEVKLPDTSFTWFNKSIDLKECERVCLQNCSCTAYANLDIRGSGCLLWFNELVDIRLISGGGQDLYLRVAASEIDDVRNKGSFKGKKLAGVIASLAVAVSAVAVGIVIYNKRRYRRESERKENLELPLFDLNIVVEATDNFSSRNKLGEGGFGPVYKGVLMDGQEIAVKRLSKSSSQGLNEFKNEIILIAKLQHRNLVKLLGCCIHGDEMILIYEYMPNKSLDSFIFDQTKGKLLDWSKRFSIINGIARGLMYLHQDSRLKIIHRDLKTSNILLDKQLNPKISDFGLARTFGIDQSHANTNKVVGTYGYMSPEYAVDGLFSVKSDVFSFGVLVLEIISGKKNRGFQHPDHDLNLLGHAWTLRTEGRAMELLDQCLEESCMEESEVIRCICVALLCVQQRPEDRPTMSSVVFMLTNDIQLAEPKLPGFFMGRNPPASDASSNTKEPYSANSITITLPEGR